MWRGERFVWMCVVSSYPQISCVNNCLTQNPDSIPRESLILATKCGFGTRRDQFVRSNGGGLTRNHILWSVDQSLQRLRTNYVDLYQIHCWDNATPVEGGRMNSSCDWWFRLSHRLSFLMSYVLFSITKKKRSKRWTTWSVLERSVTSGYLM